MSLELTSFKICPFVQRTVITLLRKELPMRRFFIILTSMIMLVNSSYAASYNTASTSLQDVPLSIWVYFDQTQSDWDIGGSKADTDVGRIGAAFTQHFSDRFQVGLFAGINRVSQGNYARTAGLTQSGGHFGVLVRMFPLKSKKFDIDTGASMAYNLVDGEASGRDVETSWIEGIVYAKGILKLDVVQISVGANYQYIDGTEKYNSTTLNQNTDIKSVDDVSGMAGIDYLVEGGAVGLHGEWGARNSISLKFSRDF
jgi:hypothetical protein